MKGFGSWTERGLRDAVDDARERGRTGDCDVLGDEPATYFAPTVALHEAFTRSILHRPHGNRATHRDTVVVTVNS